MSQNYLYQSYYKVAEKTYGADIMHYFDAAMKTLTSKDICRELYILKEGKVTPLLNLLGADKVPVEKHHTLCKLIVNGDVDLICKLF